MEERKWKRGSRHLYFKLWIFSTLFLILFILTAQAEETGFFENSHLNGYLKNETAFRIRDPVGFSKIRNIAFLEGTTDLRVNVHLYISGWAWYDAAYLFSSYDTINPPNDRNLPLPFLFQRNREDDRVYAEFREAYVDLSLQKLDLRIGRQIVVWEQLLGFRILDEINPLDFREFILPDLIDIRIPLWMIKGTYYVDKYQIEGLWIPYFVPHKPAPPGSEWELFQQLPGERTPPKTLKNSEAGVRVSRTFSGFDLAFTYLYVFDPFPTPFRDYTGFRFFVPPTKCIPTGLQINQQNADPDCGPVFHPSYNRMHIWGTQGGINFGRFILKGEASYITGKYFGTRLADLDGDNQLDHNGAWRRNHVRWGTEIDTTLWGTDLSLAFSQWIIFGWNKVLFQDPFDSFISVFGQRSIYTTDFKAQLFLLYLINNREVLVKPKATYQMTENLEIAVGMDYFYGHKETFLPDIAAPASDLLFKFVSTFVGHDRIFLEVKYRF